MFTLQFNHKPDHLKIKTLTPQIKEIKSNLLNSYQKDEFIHFKSSRNLKPAVPTSVLISLWGIVKN